MNTTSPSLLAKLRHAGDRAAWERFVGLYSPLLHHWARKLGRQESDADNLVQDVLVTLLEELPRFDYQPGRRFRGWLWTVTRNKHHKHLRSLVPTSGFDSANGVEVEAEIEGIAEEEYRRYLVDRALRLMRADFEPATWQACWGYVVEGRSPAEVAAELGLTVNAVHLAKARVLRRLREELSGLLD